MATRLGGWLLAPAVVAITACSHGEESIAGARHQPVGLPEPVLPATSYAYSDASVPFPPQFLNPGPNEFIVASMDNTPSSNPITDAGATLGRVLFYDVRLSANNTVSCSSCHHQVLGFGDTARFSRGLNGGLTRRHAMGLTNIRFHNPSQFFGDERAKSLEAAVLLPIQDTIEMGSTLTELASKLAATRYYPPLFEAAFGSPEVTSERLGKALAQFLRSIVSTGAKFDRAFAANPRSPNFAAIFTAEELAGEQLFVGAAHCSGCHRTFAQATAGTANNGLSKFPADTGKGCGSFKAASLRNIEVRAPYMHDGRFDTLEQVIEHYDTKVETTGCLDRRLTDDFGVAARRLNLNASQRSAIVAFLKTLTDSTILTAAKLSNPFPSR
jgi:cytochrome c peroxidase